MAEERDYINWAKLVEYPVYNASMMRPNPSYESSIVGIQGGTVITPDSAYEDTVKDKDTLGIKLFARRFTENNKDATIHTRIGKDDFLKVMGECVKVKPKKYVWENPDFDAMFNECIVQLCAHMNRMNLGDLFVRSGKPYILSKGQGFIYNNDIISGAFSGVILTGRYNGGSDGVMVSLTIPKLIHNAAAGNLSNATLVYTDKESNLKITMAGSSLTKNSEGAYVTESKRTNGFNVQKYDLRTGLFMVPEDSYADLMNKALRVPMTKFDFRLTGVLPTLSEAVSVKASVPTERALNRLAKIGR